MTAASAVVRESGQLPGDVLGFASWSPGRHYRWSLRRAWAGEPGAPSMTWIMLNPSVAGARKDDATIRRCVWFARRSGCSAITVVNLFAFVSTDPRRLLIEADPVGWANDQAIIDACTARDVADPEPRIVVVAWGAWAEHPRLRGRAFEVQGLLDEHSIGYQALGLSAKGHPLHPLRQPRTAQLGVISTGDSRVISHPATPAKTAPAQAAKHDAGAAYSQPSH
jgi:hypothetical protein